MEIDEGTGTVPLDRAGKNYGGRFYDAFMEAVRQDGIHPSSIREVHSFDELIFSVSIGEGIGITSREVIRLTEIRSLEMIGFHHHSSTVLACQEKADLQLKAFLYILFEQLPAETGKTL